jgi:outer membrane protein OmpA-like peptidoglycan-associated protein
MDRKWFGSVMAGALTILAVTAQAQAPAATKVQEISGAQLTSERLIEVLQPQEEAPPEFRARGAKVQPKCEFFRRQRGNPVAEIAAIQVLFAYDSADLTPEATQSLDQLGKALASSRLAPCCFQIEGHTDNEGTEEYNRSLSQRRAQKVIDYLADKFSIDRQRLMAVGKGESAPIADNTTDAGRSRNRRVQIVNLGYGQVEQP